MVLNMKMYVTEYNEGNIAINKPHNEKLRHFYMSF
jgi:hypothetical protein